MSLDCCCGASSKHEIVVDPMSTSGDPVSLDVVDDGDPMEDVLEPSRAVEVMQSYDAGTLACVFPMKCVRISLLREMAILKSHGQLEAEDCVVVPGRSDIVHFVSHEWLGRAHPDPQRVQLHRLQSMFETMARGEAQTLFSEADWTALKQNTSRGARGSMLVLESNATTAERKDSSAIASDLMMGLLWIDFCSVPQICDDPGGSATQLLEQQKLAIHSIPAYIERADYFWVLTPTARNADSGRRCGFNSWRSRGWCRMEEWTNGLILKRKMPLVITNAKRLYTVGQLDHLVSQRGRPELAVLNGDFSCCQFDHTLGGVKIPCDKDFLAPILQRLYQAKLKALRDGHNVPMYTSYIMSQPSILAGSKYAVRFDPNDSADDFCQRMESRGYTDSSTLMMVAMSDLASCEATVELARRNPSWVQWRGNSGQTLLMFAALNGDGRLAKLLDAAIGFEAPEMINIATTDSGMTSLHYAADKGFSDNITALLKYRADLHAVRRDNGRTPLHMAALTGGSTATQVLLEHGAEVDRIDVSLGSTPLHLASRPVVLTGQCSILDRLKVIRLLIAARASLSAQASGNRTAGAFANGNTPCMIAAQLCFDEAVLLLDAASLETSF